MTKEEFIEDLKKDWNEGRFYTCQEVKTKLGKSIETVRLWYTVGVYSRDRSKRCTLESVAIGTMISIRGSWMIEFLTDINFEK